ncbi:MAG: FAD-dependent oxidoreductase [Desulfobacula sp.]|mgnify:FL=1|jgi:heterodisulfide reductase subunit A-like polyferredoxin|uniref:NAD(P)-binding protein n=1 Tax=Desulfobacula sp. TaxID=2593537 RepID=UPI001DC82B64|nr:FAD-dependent oxidoreductase [Desulfobacula sp.]MBT3486544.1 FAD-dependent oxidoreductase [Desulfobacula sp.]MBT3805308.1 FAD-dependent oxidoreductase [Desulfobacula sp.]MBT4025660.1 FAD-dependent oxidoreductase [Desulfobacula sp.]MBT4197527.1 FAD-dependent oxidoreductase [Desulfobacula sp.]
MAEKGRGSVMVVGAGIAGIQASLDLADSGYLVYLVDKDTAIGGTMAQLDKTFPTNDCSMCIISPKLVEAGRHLNIELMTMTQVENVTGEEGDFTIQLKEQPRFIDLEKCTACGECSKICPVDLPNQFDEDIGDRKAAFKLYPQAMPSGFAIEKKDKAPCRLTCPAGLNVQGYVQMVKEGKYKESLEIIMEQLPLPGVLGRVCPHECEDACRRCQVDEPVAIRDLKRLAADSFDPREVKIECAPKIGKKVAIIGSGPAGLSAGYHLARQGVDSTIFEALPQAGGMLRVGIPEHRLPREVLDKDIEVVTNLGVELKLNSRLGSDFTIESLMADGYDAVFLGLGAHKGIELGIPGEDLEGVRQGVDFLRELNLTGKTHVGKKVCIVGGGNVAIDVARSAVRLGADEATILYRRTRKEMPAWEEEICAAEDEGAIITYLAAPQKVIEENGRVKALRVIKMELGEPDSSGRRRPVPIPGSEYDIEIDQLIPAIGQRPDLSAIEKLADLKISKWNTTEVNPVTLATDKAGVFAGGDVQTGPGVAIGAIAAGMEAAVSIVRYLNGADMEEGRQLPVVENPEFRPVNEAMPTEDRYKMPELEPEKRIGNFNEVELGYGEEEGKKEAARCLNCGYCSECMQCVDACLADAVDHSMMSREHTINVGAIIMAPGFTPFEPTQMVSYCYGHSPNIMTSIEFERLLSASGPYAGHLVRPSDNVEPKKIAWLQCVGSRDINKGDHSYCSGVCCMYANKQAVIAKEHSDKGLDAAIFFMDMRTHGKDFDKYNIRAQDDSGVRFVRSRIHSVFPEPGDKYRLVYSTEAGGTIEEIFDMVVLSVGLSPNKDAQQLADKIGIELNSHGFAHTDNLSPVSTNKKGVYVCGAFQEPKDIPSSVMEASAAAATATMALKDDRWSMTRTKELPPESDFSGQKPRIGVWVCNCGINIGGIADVPAVRDYAATLPYVVNVQDKLFTCSQDSQDNMKDIIKEHKLNRVIVAACSPRTHEPLFQETIRDAGLNKYLFEMANIRDQNTWVHMNEPDKATQKAKDLVRMAVAKAAYIEPLHQVSLDIQKALVVIGGGVAGMEAALGAASQGVDVHLVEKSGSLGGIAKQLNATWKGEPIQDYLEDLIDRTKANDSIQVYLDTEVQGTTGSMGNFVTTIAKNDDDSLIPIEHGAAILATGGMEYKPQEYLYGKEPNVLTHLDMDAALREEDERIDKAKAVVFVQCVGSRNEENPYCSKVCCTHSLKSALALKKKDKRKRVYVVYRDIRSYGFREDLYKEARGLGVLFIRYDLEKMPKLRKDANGELEFTVIDHVLQMPVKINPDLVVLASGVVPGDNKNLFEKFKVPTNAEGFLVEAHAKLRPVDFASDGLFVAGLAHYPKPLEESIAQARAAVARAMTILSRDSLMVGGVVAEVTPEKCAVCLTCVRTCPYGIPFIHADGYAQIDAAECHGCGACVAECPGKAIKLNHFTDQQILAKTDALFEKA